MPLGLKRYQHEGDDHFYRHYRFNESAPVQILKI